MNSTQKILVIILATLACFIGGFISNQIFQTKFAFAEKEPKPQKVVMAEEFRVVDKNSKTWPSLGFTKQKPKTIELRLITSGYDQTSPSGIIISASRFKSELWLFGAGSSITMSTFSSIDPKSSRLHIGKAQISVEGRDYPDIFDRISDNSIPTIDDSSYITMSAGPTNDGPSIEIAGRNGKTRAVIGTASLTGTKTGEFTGRPPSSLILFDKSENVIWRAP